MEATVRQLGPDDAEACAALRRTMLEEAPFAFLTSADNDLGTDPDKVCERLASGDDNVTFGAFADELVGSVGLFRERHEKTAHRVHVWGMFVARAARRRGVGRSLIQAAIDHAGKIEGVSQVSLSVSEAAPEARRLYESMNFRAWGIEPGALRHEGRVMDETHMVLQLEANPDAATDGGEGNYVTDERLTIAEAPNLRVRRLRLDAGQCVPWHYHTNITDTFFCMEGPMQVKTRDPEAVHLLEPGQSTAVGPGSPHYVSGVDGGPCRFMIVQGVGVYDYVPAE